MEEKIQVKKEILETPFPSSSTKTNANKNGAVAIPLIELSSSSSSSDSGSDASNNGAVSGAESRKKKRRKEFKDMGVVLPVGFLAPLPPPETLEVETTTARGSDIGSGWFHKQFWKAGDYYEGAACGNWELSTGGMDHVRVHPKFLHSNATSHKWALGAFAELLDNALDEFSNGATYINIDMVKNKKDGSQMLLIEDNGGGMDPDKIRHCMSLGYSAKSKIANTIGQYGNGFKTSTMRLGADVIVFSRSQGKEGKSPTQSVGLLSYTFLTSTGKEDIVVPMLDYEWEGRVWKSMARVSGCNWSKNLETIIQWSPYCSEAYLLNQFNMMSNHGTRIVIYNLWEDDEGLLELDFDADPHDIQLRGVNRDERNIKMAREYPNSRHFLTYRHSLRSYSSILYLRLPPNFRIILRQKDVEHHNIVNDMMLSQEITYRPQSAEGVVKDPNMTAVVTIGFVKDAKHHIDVQGFNVYHKNRLIKPFWRLWNPPGSDGRGVIGLLEANFVEPAHDKQGFERTTVLSRLETRLIQMQRTYWTTLCHKVGYHPRGKSINKSPDKGLSQKVVGNESARSKKATDHGSRKRHVPIGESSQTSMRTRSGKKARYSELSSTSEEEVGDDDTHIAKRANGSTKKIPHKRYVGKSGISLNQSSSSSEDGLCTTQLLSPVEDTAQGGKAAQPHVQCQSKVGGVVDSDSGPTGSDLLIIDQLREENRKLKERLERRREIYGGSPNHMQCEGCRSLKKQLQEAELKIDELNKERKSLHSMLSAERDERGKEEESLRKKIKDAYNTIQELLDKVRLLEKMKLGKRRVEK